MGTFFCPQILLPGGWAENRVVEVDEEGSVSAVRLGFPAGAELMIHEALVLGMPNLHSHSFQRAMAGLAETRSNSEDSFWSWRRRMFRFLEILSPDDVDAIATQLYLEMLKAGYTSVGEFHYLHHTPEGEVYKNSAEMSHRILSAAKITGIGLIHLPVLYRYGGFGTVEPSRQQRRFFHDSDTFLKLLDNLGPLFQGYPNRVLGIAPILYARSLRNSLTKSFPPSVASYPGVRYTFMLRSRRPKWRNALVGPVSVLWSG